jgi:EAL domain-containing protein (putative c-di-GMP-specific phosphodiesterase class I)
VETAEQHRQMADLGSESCQGFYFARPMSAETIATMTDHHPAGLEVRLPVPA